MARETDGGPGVVGVPLKWHEVEAEIAAGLESPAPPGVEYRGIPGCPGYRAGSDGTVWSCWRFKGAGYARKCGQVMTGRWRRLKGSPRPEDGRVRYTLRRADGSYRRAYGSNFVLEAFVGTRPEGMESCHENGNCRDDSVGNLRWDTAAANKADMVAHGTRLRGEAINTAKLTEDAVREIRRVGYPLRQHAERFGVTETMVSLVLKRKAWKHVE